MAKQPGLDFQSAKGGLGELKRRLLFVVGALIVFRIGSFIPIPGIDAAVLAKLLEQQRGTIIEMFNMFSGGALSRASIFALGIPHKPADALGAGKRMGERLGHRSCKQPRNQNHHYFGYSQR